MPWLTPDSIPEGDDCRPLSIPASSAWLALVSGALTELTLPYNWQKFGTLTVQETVDKMQSIVDNYYNAPCAVCEVPGGYPVVRLSISGHLEELGSDGAWHTATGDYLIPPPTARTEGTTPDQNCLAAKNATNVLFELYESLSDSFSSSLSADEALVAFIAAAVAAVGFEFAPITFAIAAIAFVVFEALFAALAYITADLWTDAFTEQFTCLLLNCAVNTAGVVTFDWDCFNNALLAQVNSMGLSEVQMRLYVQIGYMLYFIGGADGLNLAARTTAITNDDCSVCNTAWCYKVDFTLTDGSGVGVEAYGSVGTYVSGTGWNGIFVDANSQNEIKLHWAFTASMITEIKVNYYKGDGGGANNANVTQLYNPFPTTVVCSNTANTIDPTNHLTKDFMCGVIGDGLYIDINTGTAGSLASVAWIELHGTGTNPFGESNC